MKYTLQLSIVSVTNIAWARPTVETDRDSKSSRKLSLWRNGDKREHGGINGLTPSEMFLQTFNRLHNRSNTKQKSVTYVGI